MVSENEQEDRKLFPAFALFILSAVLIYDFWSLIHSAGGPGKLRSYYIDAPWRMMIPVGIGICAGLTAWFFGMLSKEKKIRAMKAMAVIAVVSSTVACMALLANMYEISAVFWVLTGFAGSVVIAYYWYGAIKKRSAQNSETQMNTIACSGACFWSVISITFVVGITNLILFVRAVVREGTAIGRTVSRASGVNFLKWLWGLSGVFLLGLILWLAFRKRRSSETERGRGNSSS